MADDFGIFVRSSTEVWSYKNGALVGKYSHPARSGTYTGIVALATTGFHVDRIEWRSGGPAGPLVDSDDFDSLAAWTIVKNDDGGGVIDPAGHVRLNGGGSSEIIRRATPTGADYVELLNAYFPTPSDSNEWGMVTINYDGSSYYGENGYRVLMREYAPNEVQVPDGTALSASTVIRRPTVGRIGFR